tara:strand:- start:53 stop:1306 length:1254 start_codon:yes stop_codon:yes gene_type:complete
MLFLYRILINFIILISPLIIFLRLIKKKENFFRFREKFCFFSKKRVEGKLIWFHGASVGELQSIFPLLKKIEKKKSFSQILVTSNTLSSSKIMDKIKSKKIIHQFFPIDSNFLTKKFLNYWKPSFVFFIDSEIWPNMIFNLKRKNIPTGLLNGRITKKTFNRWKIFSNFSKKIFGNILFCLASSNESKKYLKKLGIKNVKFLGNLKFSQLENEKNEIDNNLKNFIRTKKVWCASSTHDSEEKFCGNVHKTIKRKYRNLLTIIIPRHVERVDSIKNELQKLDLRVHIHEPKKKISNDTDIYLVNSYGKTKSFYNNCKTIFLGGSIINHGGQNPLEATRYGCKVLHGPNVHNFTEIYNFLKKNKMSFKIQNQNNLIKLLSKFLNENKNSKKIQNKLNIIGAKILDKTNSEINLFFKNEL